MYDTFNGMFLLVEKQKKVHVVSRRVRVTGLDQVKRRLLFRNCFNSRGLERTVLKSNALGMQ